MSRRRGVLRNRAAKTRGGLRRRNRRRLSGVTVRIPPSKRTSALRPITRKVNARAAKPDQKRTTYKVKPADGAGLPPLSMSSYMSMF